jgi:ABC-type branched-subunit amino acid transport system ATPase component
VLLARVLVGSPPLLVLEDLEESLAPDDVAVVRAALRVATAVEGACVLMSSSDSRLAALADRRVVLA